MKHLEDENKKLDTKLKILKEKEDYDGKIDDIVNQLESEMEEQIGNLLHDREKLQAELLRDQEEVEDTKKRSVGQCLDTPNIHQLSICPLVLHYISK